MNFTEYLRMCLVLGLVVLLCLAAAIGVVWLASMSPFNGIITVVLALVAIILVVPLIGILTITFADRIVP